MKSIETYEHRSKDANSDEVKIATHCGTSSGK